MSLRIHFDRDLARNSWAVYAFKDERHGERRMYRLTVELLAPTPDGMLITEPTAQLPFEELHDFVEAMKKGLAEAGFLADSSASQAELKATKLHLEDMRDFSNRLLRALHSEINT